jgi:hypothetical protein
LVATVNVGIFPLGLLVEGAAINSQRLLSWICVRPVSAQYVVESEDLRETSQKLGQASFVIQCLWVPYDFQLAPVGCGELCCF